MNYVKIYADFLRKALDPVKKMKAVFDCSNGTTGLVLKKLFQYKEVGLPKSKKWKSDFQKLKVILINNKPDGNFPAHGPNPMIEGAMDDLAAAIKKHKADLGAIFDGDGDRVFFMDNKGRPVAADIAIALIAQNYKGPVALDLRVGYLLRELLAKAGRRVIDSRVGHFFMKQVMAEHGLSFGGELSGHYYFRFPGYYADSGIFAAIQFINAVAELKTDLASWIDKLPHYYRSGEVNFKVKDKAELIKKIEKIYEPRAPKISRLDGIKMEFDDFWISVRPSNTEDLLRLNVEAKKKTVFDREFARIRKCLSIS